MTSTFFKDACHSLGAIYDGERVGSFGYAANFSFCFNKVITTGEGGMVVTDSREVRDRLRRLRSHGTEESGKYVDYDHNFRMSSMTAALGITQAEKLKYIIKRRREMAAWLNDALRDLDAVQLPDFPEERESIYQLYNLRFNEQEIQPRLADYLDARGIPTSVTYDPVHLTSYYRNEWGYGKSDLPVTEDVSSKILTLPFHLDLEESDLARIAEAVRSFFLDEY